MTNMPEGPWVLVIGAHRSGTSAITGALVAMGLQGIDPSDRVEWAESNPEHWESLAAALYDDELLAEVGGTWDAPPELGQMPVGSDSGRSPTDIMGAAYPLPGPLVWKDPRACLLLPYWRQVLPGPLTAVFVWRDPLAVARSLHARDGMSIEYGLALWERYNRSAAAGLQGIDTYVLDYDSLVEDPAGAFSSIADWLGDLDRFGPLGTRGDVEAAAATVDRGLHHHSSHIDTEASHPADAGVIAQWLHSLQGGHRPFATEPPAPISSWPEALVELRREQVELRREQVELRREQVELRGDLRRSLDEASALAERAEAMEQALRSGYQEEIDRLVEQLHEARQRADSLAWEVEKVTSSASWKLTRPIRTATSRLSGPPKV